jgi:hypothetical protein
VSGIAYPFDGHLDEFRIAHVQRADRWVETTWKNRATSVRSPRQGPRSSEGQLLVPRFAARTLNRCVVVFAPLGVASAIEINFGAS